MRPWLIAVPLLLTPVLRAQAPVPVGVQFQINSYTTDSQGGAAIALVSLGRFVVVWNSWGSYGTDTDQTSVQGQRYDANGAPVGGEFQVNSYTTGRNWIAEVASDAVGNFVVVWVSEGSYSNDTSSYSIQAQRYDASGTPVGSQFQVNSYTTGSQSRGEVAADAQGNFVVAWYSDGSFGADTDSRSIQAQRYDADGVPVGGEFQVNSYTPGRQENPKIASDALGNFVVVWQSRGSYGTDTDNWSIQAQRYDADGAPVGGQFQVNSYTTLVQRHPVVAADALGNFVVVWAHFGYGENIQGQRYDAAGNAVGSQFQVNSYTTSPQRLPSIARESDGDFVVVWSGYGSYGTDTSYNSIQAQRYDADGAPVGGQFQVNSYWTSYQSGAAVAADAQSNFVVAWGSDGSDGTDTSNASIQGQRFTESVFADGFESGDTSAWSSTVE